MDDLTMDQMVLARMAELLNSDGINYSVFLRAYCGTMEDKTDVSEIVKGLIGDEVVISEVHDADVADVTETLRQSLGYAGNEGAGPGPRTLESAEFSGLLASILETVAQLSASSSVLKSFEFAQGHPAYPVFWDCAFLFSRGDEHLLLVGSSSD